MNESSASNPPAPRDGGNSDALSADGYDRQRALRHARIGTLVWIGSATLILFLLVPLVALLLRASEHVEGLNRDTWQVVRQALALTIFTSLISLAIIILLGTPLAYLLARRAFPGRRVVETLIDLPMVLPPAVAGFALLMAFGRRGLLGQELERAGITLGFTTAAVILAQTFVSVPFFVRSARAGFARVATDLEEIAADLGAMPRTVFRTVTLPLAWPAIAAGIVLAWARAVGEFGATIIFAGNFPGRTQTMTLAIYGRYEAGDLDTALLLAVILLATSFLFILGARSIADRQSRARG